MFKRLLSLLVLLVSLSPIAVRAEDGHQLTLTIGKETRQFTQDALLARPMRRRFRSPRISPMASR